MADSLYATRGGQLLGQLVAVPQEGSRVHVARTWEEATAWRRAMDAGDRIPSVGYAISEAGVEAVCDDQVRLRRFIACALNFRDFLRVWWFLDQDTGVHRLLGESLWPGQEEFARVAALHPWVYFLKARQLGETTIAIAYDAWVLRFRAHNARVHLVSRTETLAKTSLLKPLKFGLRRLPEEMRLPGSQDTSTIYELDAGPDDRRIVQAYAAKEPGRGETCSHLHLDEWAAMAETGPELPKDVWAAAEPTISKQGGSCHILTTGVGPVGFYADVWRQCEAGEGSHHACFIGASGSRPEYTREFLDAKRRRLGDDTKFMREYPERPEDALAGGGGTRFRSTDIDQAGVDARGFGPAGSRVDGQGRTRRRRYLKVWDIAGPGKKSDAVVGLALDVSEPVWDVVSMDYNRGEAYPVTAMRIEALHRAYPGPTVIEDNEAGAAVRSFLNIPEEECIGFRTTSQSKPVIIEELAVALAYQSIKWRPEECPKLDKEMRHYRLPDDSIEQDCVMALAIGVHHGAAGVAQEGRVGGVIRF